MFGMIASTLPAFIEPTWTGWPLSCALSVETYSTLSRQALNARSATTSRMTAPIGKSTRRLRNPGRRRAAGAGAAASPAFGGVNRDVSGVGPTPGPDGGALGGLTGRVVVARSEEHTS